MLNRMEKLIGMSIRASDGELGKVKDAYFDDHRWAARYLVVDTGGWLEGRKGTHLPDVHRKRRLGQEDRPGQADPTAGQGKSTNRHR
jgi:hypothetical protein